MYSATQRGTDEQETDNVLYKPDGYFPTQPRMVEKWSKNVEHATH